MTTFRSLRLECIAIVVTCLSCSFVFSSCRLANAESLQQSFQDCELCPEMVPIPPGRVLVGIARGVEERLGVPVSVRKRGEPVTEVIINYRFAVGRFEITRAQFEAFVREAKYEPPNATGCWDGYGRLDRPTNDPLRRIGRNNKLATHSWLNPGFPQTAQHPVVCVSLPDIRSYLHWLSQKTGRNYRLLSESEWTYIASEGTKSPWPWGTDAVGACLHGNVSDMTRAVEEHLDLAPDNVFQCFDGFVHTSPGGSFVANEFQLYDLFGNAAEVVADCLRDDLEKMPRDGSPYEEPNCPALVSKGGSWDIFPYSTLTGFRASFGTAPGERYSYSGFRVSTTLSP
jgi:formylglycine-generating enzyme required for sulfatase activity